MPERLGAFGGILVKIPMPLFVEILWNCQNLLIPSRVAWRVAGMLCLAGLAPYYRQHGGFGQIVLYGPEDRSLTLLFHSVCLCMRPIWRIVVGEILVLK